MGFKKTLLLTTILISSFARASTLEMVLRSGEKEGVKVVESLFKAFDNTTLNAEAIEFFMSEMVAKEAVTGDAARGFSLGRGYSFERAYAQQMEIFRNSIPGVDEILKKDITQTTATDAKVLASASRRMLADPTLVGPLVLQIHGDRVMQAATTISKEIERRSLGVEATVNDLTILSKGTFVSYKVRGSGRFGLSQTVMGSLNKVENASVFMKQAERSHLVDKANILSAIYPESVMVGGNAKELVNQEVRVIWMQMGNKGVALRREFNAQLLKPADYGEDVQVYRFLSADDTAFELPVDRVLWMEAVERP